MKFKMIGIMSILLLAVLAMGVACAADNNLTDDMVGIENTQNDGIALEQKDNDLAVDDNANQNIKSDKDSKDMLAKSNDGLLASSDGSSAVGATITSTATRTSNGEPAKLKASNSEPAKLTATKKKMRLHVKVGKYVGKLTAKQYKKLKVYYKTNDKYGYVTIKCANKKYHKITIQYFNGINGMNGKYYSRGFYATVWDTRYGMDGLKIVNKRPKFY